MIFLIGILALIFAGATYGFLEASNAERSDDGRPDYWNAITCLSVMAPVGMVLLFLILASLT